MDSVTDIDAELPAHIEHALDEYLCRAREPINHVAPFTGALEALRTFVLGGGKRIRPTFAWWAWRGAGGDARGDRADGALQAVAALELIQACALIHDDVMDDSDSRRGAPTVHVAFADTHAQHRWHGSPARFGLAAAVLIGDVALAWADDMFATADLPEQARAAARPAWQAMRTEVLAGQYLDVHNQAACEASPEAALRVNELKTAAYTVKRPLHIGAALAGADAALIDALLSFGNDIGIAFQLRDDLLGLLGDPEVTGKPAGDDLREGKRTLLVAVGLEHARQQSKQAAGRAISEAVTEDAPTDEQVERAVDALSEVGAVDTVERRITQLTGTALESLRRAALAEPASAKLTELAHAATSRSR